METVTIELEVKIAYLVIRQISYIIKTASAYKADIQMRNVTKDSPSVNAKRALDIAANLQASRDDIVELKAEGEDAAEAIEAIRELFESNFDEQPEE